MQKITEIKETKYRTVREKDALGNRISKKVPYQGQRKVNVVSGGIRFAHFFVDLTIYYMIYYTILFIYSVIVPFKDNPVQSMTAVYNISVLLMFLFPLYYIAFEGIFQRTPGKFLTKTIVIDVYGKMPDLSTNILRNIIRLVPFEVLSCINERGWHDKWSDTYVVKTEEYNRIKELLNSTDYENGETIIT